MTANQLTYLQLAEQMRANRAQEALREQAMLIEQPEHEERAKLLRQQAEQIFALLPAELELTQAQKDEAVRRAEESFARTIQSRVNLGDTSAYPDLESHFVPGGNERAASAWEVMTTPEKINTVISHIIQGIEYIIGLGAGRQSRSSIGSNLGTIMEFFSGG